MSGHGLVLSNAHPSSLTVTCESNKIQAQTAFITKGVIGNDPINMYSTYSHILMGRLSWTNDIEE